jgi:hypothetical protein
LFWGVHTQVSTSSDVCRLPNALLGGVSGRSLSDMTLKARVRAGRLVVDLLPLDPGDWLDDADRAALHQALRDFEADVAAGRLIDAAEMLNELRAR